MYLTNRSKMIREYPFCYWEILFVATLPYPHFYYTFRYTFFPIPCILISDVNFSNSNFKFSD